MNNFLSRLKRIPLDRNRILLIIIICVLLVYADFNFLLKVQLKNLGFVTAKAASLRKDIVNLKKELKDLGRQKILAPNLSKARKIAPESQKQELTQYIYDAASDYRVKVIQLKPWSDPRAKEEMFGKLKLLPAFVSLDLSCGYHELGGFINALENGKYFIAVSDMRITCNPQDIFRHNVTLVLKSYVKR